VSCHMPRYPTSNVAHTTLTNHTVPVGRVSANSMPSGHSAP
jgi:hypothetical protein